MHYWDSLNSIIRCSFEPVFVIGCAVFAMAFWLPGRQPRIRMLRLLACLAGAMVLWRVVVGLASSRYAANPALLFFLGCAVLVEPEWWPERLGRWRTRCGILLIGIVVLAGMGRSMKVACNIKDFTAISSVLERLTAKSIRPKIIVLNREAARIGYFFRGCPVFDGTVFEKARVELQYSDWENDIVLFVGDPERMKVFSEEFPGGLQADEVFLDSGTGFRIYRRINQAFSSHRALVAGEAAARLAPDECGEDFENPVPTDAVLRPEFGELQKRGLELPASPFPFSAKLIPNPGHRFNHIRDGVIRLIGPESPEHIAGRYSLLADLKTDSGGFNLEAVPLTEGELRGELLFRGGAGARIEVLGIEIPDGSQPRRTVSIARAGCPAPGKIYKLEWSYRAESERNIRQVIPVLLLNGRIVIDNIRVVSGKRQE